MDRNIVTQADVDAARVRAVQHRRKVILKFSEVSRAIADTGCACAAEDVTLCWSHEELVELMELVLGERVEESGSTSS